jgi:hypothetical protein
MKCLTAGLCVATQVNAAGVMPVIFATTLMSLPSGVARFANVEAMETLAALLYPSSPVYLPTYVALIVFFNYYYTFLQLDPKDVSDQLRKQVHHHLNAGLYQLATTLSYPPPRTPLFSICRCLSSH